MKLFFSTLHHRQGPDQSRELHLQFLAEGFADAAHYLDGFIKGYRFLDSVAKFEILSLGTSKKRGVEYTNLESF